MKNKHYVSAAVIAALWLVLAAFAWFGPRQDISEAERRKLQQMPELTAQNISSGLFMSKFETFTQDQFPLRDGFRQLKSLFSYRILRQKDSHGVYIVGNQAAKLEYPLQENRIYGAKEKFQKIYDLYLKDNCSNIVFSVVPDKGYYLAEKAGAPAMDYDRLFEITAELPWAKHVDITDCLTGDDYYNTDAHWRQERLIPAAGKLAHALGCKGPEPEDYSERELGRDFYGVYYGQAALPMDPDRIRVLESEILKNCTVTNLENGKQTEIYDPEKLDSRDLYDVFLSGPVSVLTIDNPAGTPGKELVVFRDSFGSSLVPLLMEDYAKVTLVDIRYVPTNYVNNFLEFQGQDVLFLYSTTVLNSSTVLK